MSYKKPAERSATEWAQWEYYRANPVEGVKDLFKVTPDDWQGDLLTSLFNGEVDRVAAKAAHGPGKTALDAWSGLLFLNCYENCRVVATAPTMAQLHDVLFPEYAKWLSKMPSRVEDEWVVSGGHIRHKRAPYDWFAVARTSNNPANLQGFHGTHLLIQADEASAIGQPVFEVMEGALSEAGEQGKVAKLIMAGNPNFNSGELHDAFYRNKELYHRLTITGDKSLLTQLGVEQGGYHQEHGRVYYSSRIKAKYCKTIEKKYGFDSAVYDVRVRGIFPRAADDTVIALEWAERAATLDPPPFDPVAHGFTVIVDPSRGGAAETAIGVARQGILIEVNGHKGTKTVHQVAALTNEVVMRYRAQGLRLDEVVCDLPGVGGGVIDVLRTDYNLPVRAYDGGKPLVKGIDPDDECQMFVNRRARDWWALRRKLEIGGYPIPDDEILIAQLASPKYRFNGQEKIQVESKDDMKDRLGPEASPDRGDVLVMAQAPFYDGMTVQDIHDLDIIEGEDRPTAQYRDEMDAGLV